MPVKYQWAILAAALACGAYFMLFLGPHWSGETRRLVGEKCREWIEDELAEGSSARVLRDWNKNGRAVFAIGIPEDGSTSYSIHLCVVDPGDMSLLKPSVFDTARWTR
jgi:hypothetical protein